MISAVSGVYATDSDPTVPDVVVAAIVGFGVGAVNAVINPGVAPTAAINGLLNIASQKVKNKLDGNSCGINYGSAVGSTVGGGTSTAVANIIMRGVKGVGFVERVVATQMGWQIDTAITAVGTKMGAK